MLGPKVYAFVILLGVSTIAQADDCPFVPRSDHTSAYTMTKYPFDLHKPFGLQIFNVYWKDNWDASQPYTQQQIDNATKAIINSGYFSRSCQYGVPNITFGGGRSTAGFTPCQSNPPPLLATPLANEFIVCEEESNQVATVKGLADLTACSACNGIPGLDCWLDFACYSRPNTTGDTIFNVFVPAGSHFTDYDCSHALAFHSQLPTNPFLGGLGLLPGGRPMYVAFIPLDCNPDFATLMDSVAHEDIEAATNPFAGPSTWFNDTLPNGETADICQDIGWDNVPFSPPASANTLPFNLAPYWSNYDEACVLQDVNPPTDSASKAPPPSPTGWNKSDVTVTISALDKDVSTSRFNGATLPVALLSGGTGVKSITYKGNGATDILPTTVAVTQSGNSPATTSFVVKNEGITAIDYHATDNQSLSSVDQHLQVMIDKTLPLMSISTPRNPLPNQYGWNNTNVSATFVCQDATSGIAFCSDIVTLTSEGTNQSIVGSAVDGAGNSVQQTIAGINIDKTPPALTPSRLPGPNAYGWNNSSVVVGFACTDSLSNVLSCTPGVTLTGEGANQSVSGTGTDFAFNATTVTVGPVNIDETPPLVAYAGQQSTYTVDQFVSIACSATDALSGVRTSSCATIAGPAYAFGVGTSSYSASATDFADNVASATVTFTVVVTFPSLENLTKRFVAQHGIQNSLVKKLQNADAAAQRGDNNAKVGMLGAYVNEVNAQAGKAITQGDADILVHLVSFL